MGQRPLDLRRDGRGRGAALEARQDERELVPAEAGDRVALARAGEEPPADLEQEGVAGVVAERVVDVLEAVEVEQEERGLLPVPPAFRQRLQETVVEERPVRQVGQGVVVGEVADPRLRPEPVGDVALDGHEVADRPGGLAHRGERGLLLEQPAVLAAGGQDAVPGLAPRDDPLHRLVPGVLPLGHEQRERGLADRLLAGIARDALERRVHVPEAAGRVGDLDRVARVVERRGQEGVAPLSLLELRDVHRDGDDAGHPAGPVPQRRLRGEPGARLAGGVRQHLLEQRDALAGLEHAPVDRAELPAGVRRRGAERGQVAVAENLAAAAVAGADPGRHGVDDRLQLRPRGRGRGLGDVRQLEARADAAEGPEQQDDEDGGAGGDPAEAPEHLPVDAADALPLGGRDLLVLQHRVGDELVERDLERLRAA